MIVSVVRSTVQVSRFCCIALRGSRFADANAKAPMLSILMAMLSILGRRRQCERSRNSSRVQLQVTINGSAGRLLPNSLIGDID